VTRLVIIIILIPQFVTQFWPETTKYFSISITGAAKLKPYPYAFTIQIEGLCQIAPKPAKIYAQKFPLTYKTSRIQLNARYKLCNNNQRQSAQLGSHGDSTAPRAESLTTAMTAGSTETARTISGHADVGRREIKIQTTSGVSECSIQAQSSESHVHRFITSKNAY